MNCDDLETPRMREICNGTSGLPPDVAAAYRARWAARTPTPGPDFSCIHRGRQTRAPECELCGGRVGEIPVYACALFGECSEHAHGIRADGPASPKIPVCLACDERVSVYSAF